MSSFVGFGFGPIQAGLFLAEAALAGTCARLVVAEVLPDVVAAVRQTGHFTVNVGYTDAIRPLTVGPVELYMPAVPADRACLVEAVADATELATALPDVTVYTAGGPESAAAILADGLLQKLSKGGPPAVVYTAENHPHAAALLAAAVSAALPAPQRTAALHAVQFLDTVIGKMSGSPEECSDLQPIAPGLRRAFLVESFNRIYISQIQRPANDPAGWQQFERAIQVFVEQPDLLPFAEAKLYCHNAGHALAAYLAHALGYQRMDELRQRPDLLDWVRGAMREESGPALCSRFAGVDPLFTEPGIHSYVDDLVERMVNPFVRDRVSRVGRDPARKLAWNDRLVGAMRRAWAAGIPPQRYAFGVAAALAWQQVASAQPYLQTLWQPANPAAPEEQAMLALITQAQQAFASWQQQGHPPLADPDTQKRHKDG